jgi:hypothetical protein
MSLQQHHNSPLRYLFFEGRDAERALVRLVTSLMTQPVTKLREATRQTDTPTAKNVDASVAVRKADLFHRLK